MRSLSQRIIMINNNKKKKQYKTKTLNNPTNETMVRDNEHHTTLEIYRIKKQIVHITNHSIESPNQRI